MEPSSQVDSETQKENAEVLAELNLYNQQHGTHYNYPEDANALFYECEGGGIRRDDLLKFPMLLAFWDAANVTNEWEAANKIPPAVTDEELPF